MVTKLTEGVSERLHALTVFVNGGVTLRQGVELVAEEDSPGLLIGAEDPLDGKPELPGSRLSSSMARPRMESSTEPNIHERT
jgi:hypothetical protein